MVNPWTRRNGGTWICRHTASIPDAETIIILSRITEPNSAGVIAFEDEHSHSVDLHAGMMQVNGGIEGLPCCGILNIDLRPNAWNSDERWCKAKYKRLVFSEDRDSTSLR